MGLSTRATLRITAEQTTTGAPAVLAPGRAQADYEKALVLLSGIGADQADVFYAERKTVAASTTQTTDLSGALLNPFGVVATFAKLKLIALINRSATQTLTLQRPAANGVPWLAAAGDAIPVPPGGFAVVAAPTLGGLAAVTAGTGDLVDVVNPAGGPADYDLIAVGTSA